MYEYKARVIKVYDGDTVTVDIDLGFGVWLKKQSIRLSGIDTPELRGDERPDGLIAKKTLSNWILNTDVLLVTSKDSKGKYGRWLCEIFPLNRTNETLSFNQRLLNEGLAEDYK